jgi:hypothetical protein
MLDAALILLTGCALGAGCIHNWRYLRRVHHAGDSDRAARERVLAQYRRAADRGDETRHGAGGE